MGLNQMTFMFTGGIGARSGDLTLSFRGIQGYIYHRDHLVNDIWKPHIKLNS